MRLAITGAGGLLGSALLDVAEGHEVFSIYNEHKPRSGIPVRVDLRDLDALTRTLDDIKPDAIIHVAAVTDVDLCERERELAELVNHRATSEIAKRAASLGAFLVYVSTDYVFDGKRGMYSEDDKPNPVNFYGITKLRGEEDVRRLLSEYLIVRSSVIYGSPPSSGKVNFALWLINSLKKGKQVKVVSDQFVSPTLNASLAGMIMECIERRLTGTIHLAGATRLSRLDFALQLCKAFSLDCSLITPVRMDAMNWYAPRPRDSSLAVTKAEKVLKNGPQTVTQSLIALKRKIEADAKEAM